MAVLYTYTKYKDLYSLTNENLNSITYTLSRKECDTLTIVEQKVLTTGQVYYIPLVYTDGIYQIDITDGISTVHIYDIFFYKNLIDYVINNVEELLCGCGCDECNEESICALRLNTLISTNSFAYLHVPKYTDYIDIIARSLNCEYTENVLATLANKMINGKEDFTDLFNKIIGMHYLAFYLVDTIQATDDTEAIYIKEKYKYVKIAKCLKKIGVNIKEITESLIGNLDVYYWQLDNPIDNLVDITGLFINNDYLHTKPKEDFIKFEEGKTVNYATIGRICFAIQETDILNFVVYDSLNNDITDQFNTQYFAGTKTFLFVSKNVYSISNIYFNFKKNIYS